MCMVVVERVAKIFRFCGQSLKKYFKKKRKIYLNMIYF